MTATTAGTVDARKPGLSRLWQRQLDRYPDTGPRTFYLAVTVLATVMLYYELYVAGSVSTLILQKLHMGFSFFVVTLAIGNLIGAFGSLFAGITDRLGRTNLVVVGLLITGILVVWVIPAQTGKWGFTAASFAVGLVEGICLVATPALIRDFSPQTGRATAMGFWTSGPVLGSLVVSVVGSNTVPTHAAPGFWTHEYHICGVAGLVVWLVTLVGLRELSPRLRDQLMVSMHDRALVEARARGLTDEEISAATRSPFRQLLKPDVVISAIGISIFLLVYYTAVGFGVIYLTTVFGFSLKDANGIGNWNWGLDLIALVIFGVVSDRFRVRKPFMVAGGIGSCVLMVLYLLQAGHSNSGYYHIAALTGILAFFLGVAYVPWMASFTETVEAHNPALTATGLAIWGWIIRVVVFVAYMFLPVVINTVNPLVNYGTEVSTYTVGQPRYHVPGTYQTQFSFAETHPQVVATATRLAPELAAIGAHPTLFAELSAHPTPALIAQAEAAVGPQLFGQIVANQAAIKTVIPYAAQLGALSQVPKPVLAYVTSHGPSVAKAATDTPGQWKTWYWICFGCMIFFVATVPLMRGRWSPAAARRDEEAHEEMVRRELAKLEGAKATV
jgi:MFS family permease